MALPNRNHHPYADEYSLVEIVYDDGTTTTFMMKASSKIAKYLGDELLERQCLVLRNDTDALVVPRERIRSLAIRTVTSNTE